MIFNSNNLMGNKPWIVAALAIAFLSVAAILPDTASPQVSLKNLVDTTEGRLGEPDKSTTSDVTLSAEGVLIKIAELQKDLERLSFLEEKETDAVGGVLDEDLRQNAALVHQTKATYERLKIALAAKERLEKDGALLQEKLKKEKEQGLPAPPPYNLSFLDSLQADLSHALQEKENIQLALSSAQKNLKEFRDLQKQTQSKKRLIRDILDTREEELENREGQRTIDRLAREIDLNEARVLLENQKAVNLNIQLSLSKLRIDLLEKQIDWVRERLTYDEQDLLRQLEILAARSREFQELLEKVTAEQEAARGKWREAQLMAATVLEGLEATIAQARYNALEQWQNTFQAVLENTEDMQGLVLAQQEIWKKRYALLSGEQEPEKLLEWLENCDLADETLRRNLNLMQDLQVSLQSQIAQVETQVRTKVLPPQITPFLHDQLLAMRKMAQRRFEYMSVILSTLRANAMLAAEIRALAVEPGVLSLVEQVRRNAKKIWDLELWVIDDHSVTFRKALVAVILLIVGFLAAKIFLRLFVRRLLLRTHVNENTAAITEKVLTFAAYLLVLLFALRIVNIPLAAFAFLGGAVAIGVGFGAQNLLNNLISGFIIMTEQPISIGNLVEVEGVVGIVEDIGARCTRIRTGSNIHILVPNSSFLEKNITNWTLADNRIRTHVTVGVVYGSPVDKVEQLLLDVADRMGRILKNPKPFVVFQDFGDNALIFELHFWIVVRRIMDKILMQSALRFEICAVLAEHEIIVAFPQRDVHLDANRPLEVRMVEGKEEKEED